MGEELIKKLKESGVVEERSVVLKHAGESKIYVHIKKAYGNPVIMNKIADGIWNMLNKDATCITAAGYGGLSPASIISSVYGLKLTMIREEEKDHGHLELIEGHVPSKEDKIVLFDDVLTTGRSLRHMIEVLEPTEAEILGCYVVVKRNEVDLGVPVHHMMTLEELTQT
jgi:orotate phosphoribosyltransferase